MPSHLAFTARTLHQMFYKQRGVPADLMTQLHTIAVIAENGANNTEPSTVVDLRQALQFVTMCTTNNNAVANPMMRSLRYVTPDLMVAAGTRASNLEAQEINNTKWAKVCERLTAWMEDKTEQSSGGTIITGCNSQRAQAACSGA